MDESQILEWITDSPKGFIIGVIILVFGSHSILSRETWATKLSGLGWIAQRLTARQDAKAQAEAKEIIELRAREAAQHAYILWVTAKHRDLEIWAAKHGHTLPPPPFVDFLTFQEHPPE